MDHESLALMVAVLRKHFVAYCTDKIAELDVTYGQLFVLIMVSKRPGCAPKTIAEYLKLDAGHLNRTLNKLVEKKLITQKKNSSDRRANIINLTEKGAHVVAESRRLFHSWDEQVLRDIDDDSRQILMNVMKTIVSRLHTDNGGHNNEQTQ